MCVEFFGIKCVALPVPKVQHDISFFQTSKLANYLSRIDHAFFQRRHNLILMGTETIMSINNSIIQFILSAEQIHELALKAGAINADMLACVKRAIKIAVRTGRYSPTKGDLTLVPERSLDIAREAGANDAAMLVCAVEAVRLVAQARLMDEIKELDRLQALEATQSKLRAVVYRISRASDNMPHKAVFHAWSRNEDGAPVAILEKPDGSVVTTCADFIQFIG